MNRLLSLTALIVLTIGCASSSSISLSDKVTVKAIAEVDWEMLNPARGKSSPKAATLWGDRNGEVETGFLVMFVDGFSSPAHIHNVTYRGIVMEGLVHNDDPKAENMWMPKLSYWTQPAGEPHITSAKGPRNIAFIEIDKGPYLVRPIKEAFDNGERPYNIHSSNIVWDKDDDVDVAYLWENKAGEVSGALVKFSGSEELEFEDARVVLIQGELVIGNMKLSRGSLITVDGEEELELRCTMSQECVVYVKSTNLDF